MPSIQSKQVASAPPPLRIRLPHRLTTRAETPDRPRVQWHAIGRVARQPEPASWEYIAHEDVERRERDPIPHRPCVRVAAISVSRPETQDPDPDPFGLGRHLEEQRRPREQQPPRSGE